MAKQVRPSQLGIECVDSSRAINFVRLGLLGRNFSKDNDKITITSIKHFLNILQYYETFGYKCSTLRLISASLRSFSILQCFTHSLFKVKNENFPISSLGWLVQYRKYWSIYLWYSTELPK